MVNGLVGERVADEEIGLSTTETTQKLTTYDTVRRKVNVTIFDSPGLEDGSGKEDVYLNEMKRKCEDV